MSLRILILSRVPIGGRVSSPGIRYLNMARVLRESLPHCSITLASPPYPGNPADQPEDVVIYTPATVLPLALRHDVVISLSFPTMLSLTAPLFQRPVLVLDFFSQFHMEWMELGRDLYRGLHRKLWTQATYQYINLQLQLADFIICANERQRDAYVGVMTSLGLLTPEVLARDPTARRLIDVAQHGVRSQPFPERRGSIKGQHRGIRPEDKLLLWLGGILYWYDPVTLLRAFARVAQRRPEAKLLFLGSAYPTGDIGQGVRFEEAIDEAKRLGLWERSVFFDPEWLPHDAVVDYLIDADIAVTTYFANGETRFAHRTRFLDYIWAGIPIVCTEGDVLADAVHARDMGITVPERDEDALFEALTRLIEDEDFARECHANLLKYARETTWEKAFEPLVRFLSTQDGPLPITKPRSQRRLPLLRSAASYAFARFLERSVRLSGALVQRAAKPYRRSEP